MAARRSFTAAVGYFLKSAKGLGLLTLFITILLTLTLVRLTWIDLHSFRLPDLYTLPLIAAGVTVSVMDGGIGLPASLIGGALGFGLFWAVGTFYFSRKGIEGLGLGDAKLFAASGTWLGVMWLPHVLLIAAGGGLIFALVFKRHRTPAIAFGPWLALGFWSVWIFVQLTSLP